MATSKKEFKNLPGIVVRFTADGDERYYFKAKVRDDTKKDGRRDDWKKLSDDWQIAETQYWELKRKQALGEIGVKTLEKVSWETFLKRFLDYYLAARDAKNVIYSIKFIEKNATIRRIEDYAKTSIEAVFGKCLKGEIRKPNGKMYKPNYLDRCRHDYIRMGTMMVEWRYADKNPISGLSKVDGTDEQKIKYLTDEELARYFLVAWGKYYDYGMIALYTGGRPEEVLRLQRKNLDLVNGAAYIENKQEELGSRVKTRKHREVPLAAEGLNYCRERFGNLKPDDLLIPRDDGQPMLESSFRYNMTRFIKPRANIPHLIPYCFRHTFAVKVYAETKDLKGLAELLGNTVEVCEKHYAALLPDHKKKMMEKIYFNVAGLKAQYLQSTAKAG